MVSYSKNSAQSVYFVLLDTSGAAVTGASPSGYVSIDQSGQSALAGSFTEEGNGQYRYDATAGEFDGDEVGFLFTGAGAVPVNVTIRTSTHTPQTGDTYGALPANFSDLAITATDGYVTVGTVNDKTGYTISGTTQTLDALQTHGDSNWTTATGFLTSADEPIDVNVTHVAGSEVTGVSDFQADVSGLSTHDAAAVVSAFLADSTWDASDSTLSDFFQQSFAISRGKIVANDDETVFAYKDTDDDTTVVTLTIDEDAGTRTPS